jgi:hypothetical protein
VKVGFVDLAHGTWHIPVPKSQRSHTIHLSDLARGQFKLLEALRTSRSERTASPSSWVFANDAGDGPVGVKTLGKQLSDRQRDAKSPLCGRSKSTTSLSLPSGRWTAHDLRRTAATFMAALGVSGDVIDECLNHVIESRVRRTYIRGRRIVQQRQALMPWASFSMAWCRPVRQRPRDRQDHSWPAPGVSRYLATEASLCKWRALNLGPISCFAGVLHKARAALAFRGLIEATPHPPLDRRPLAKCML